MNRSDETTLRSCSVADVEGIVQFVESCPPLDLHTPFTYWVTLRYWGRHCFVATMADRIVGYASAIGSGGGDDVLYLWQIGVASELRGRGLAQRLIESVADVGRESGFQVLQVSIAPDNEASLRAFRRFAASRERSLDPAGEVSFCDPRGKPVHEDVYALEIR